MTAPKKLNARLSLLLLVFGLVLIGANMWRNLSWIRDRRIARFEEEMTEMGVRLSGMMQHFVRRGMSSPAELEMSYAATTPQLELGLVCDSGGRVIFSTHLQWVGVNMSTTSLGDASSLGSRVRSSMTPRVVFDHAQSTITGAFPFYEHYHSRDRGVVVLRFYTQEALRLAKRDAMLESAAHACALLALCALLWLALDILVTRRVQQLAEYAIAMGRGDEIDAKLAGGDELTVVASSFESAVNELLATENRLLETAEAERRRIGADLHDDVCQRVTAAQLKSGVLESVLRREGHPKALLAEAIAGDLARAVQVTRAFAQGLAPIQVQRGRLADALQELARTLADTFAIPFKCTCDLDGKELALWVDTHVYRIVQELAVNAAKHAKPTAITINLVIADDILRLSVESDGRPVKRGGSRGMGLALIAQRVRALGGQWSLDPTADHESPHGSRAWCEVRLEEKHYADEAPRPLKGQLSPP